MFKQVVVAVIAFFALSANASVDVPITGNIESKCVISVDTAGVYGNPTSDKLSTAPTDGGVVPIVRYDIIEANTYKARVTSPESFTSSPSLNDIVNWTGSTEVAQTSDATMSSFETDKVEFENVTEFDLTVAGSVWFKTNSTAEYGFNKSFPGGTYRSAVLAECIAK